MKTCVGLSVAVSLPRADGDGFRQQRPEGGSSGLAASTLGMCRTSPAQSSLVLLKTFRKTFNSS